MTRSGPAKALGLRHFYGGLAPGKDGNVVVYDLDPEPALTAECSRPQFQRAAWFVKTGEIVVKDGEIMSHGNKTDRLGQGECPREPAGKARHPRQVPEGLHGRARQLRGHATTWHRIRT